MTNNSVKGRLFESLESKARQQRQIAQDACNNFNRSPSKGHLNSLKKIFKKYGSALRIEPGFRCDYGDKISFGDNCFVNYNCVMLDGGLITLGDDVLIGPNVQILTINHSTAADQRLSKQSFAQDVNIKNNVWIGAGAIILPGVTIGEGAVVAAGSVVTKDIDKATLVAGNPARALRAV